MQARRFKLLILFVGLTLILTQAVGAQGQGPLVGLSEGNPLRLPPDRGNVVAREMQPAIALGQPGTVFRYVQTFGVTEEPYLADTQHLNGPEGLFTDSSDNLYVTEGRGGRVLKYNPAGNNTLVIGKAGKLGDLLESPVDVATDGSGNIWVVDYGPHRVVQYDANGVYQQQLGEPWISGTDNAHFGRPYGIAFDTAGRMYVSDMNNHRIQIYAFSEGSPVYSATIGTTGIAGTDNAHFNQPHRIAIDGSDNLYVADAGNHRVQIFDSSHAYVATIGVSGESGSDNAHLNWPVGVYVRGGRIYIVDRENWRVQIFDQATRAYQSTIGTGWGWNNDQFAWPLDVTLDSVGNVYVADHVNHRVQKFNSSGAYVSTIGVTRVPYLTDGYHFNFPRVAIDPMDNIIVVEEYGLRLIKLNSTGVFQWSVGEAGVEGSDNAHFSWPHGVAADKNGRIYVADNNNRIQIYNSDGSYYATLGTGWGTDNYQFDWPAGIAVGDNGYIYVSDCNNRRVQIYNSSRVYVATLGVTGESGSDNNHFGCPIGIEVDTAGNIYVADACNARVQKFDSNRQWQMTLGTVGSWGQDFARFDSPEDIAIDSQGRIYVADIWNQRVQVFDDSGAYLTTIGGVWGNNNSQFRHVSGVEVDNAGNVYVCDLINGRIQKFAPGVPGWEQMNINGFGERQNESVEALEVFDGQLYAEATNYNAGTRIWRTSDGTTWTAVTPPGFGSAYTNTNALVYDMIVFHDQLYAGTGKWWDDGIPGQIWRSPDGTTWTQVVGNGFGNANNVGITTFGIFEDTLYAATFNTVDGLEIWQSSSGDSSSWTRVVNNGFGGGSDHTVCTGLIQFGNHLYAATEDSASPAAGAQVWRTANGTFWAQANTNGFGDPDNYQTGGFAVLGNYLYVGTCNDVTGAQIWRSSDGTSWTQVVGDGLGDRNNYKVEALAAFDGALYAGTDNQVTGIEVWRSTNGTAWTQVNPDGFGDSNNAGTLWSSATAAFNGSLYIGTINWAGNGGEIWRMRHQVYLPGVLRGYTPPVPYMRATFDGPTCEWGESDTSLFKSGCLDGELQMLIKVADQNLYHITPNLPSADFGLSADVRFVSSVYGTAALIFDVNANHNFYIFALSSSGSYGLWTQGVGWKQLVGWMSAPGFNALGSNWMKMEREGSAIRLYLNGRHLTTVEDTTLTGELGTGVYVQSYWDPGLDVRWDNFAAYPLE